MTYNIGDYVSLEHINKKKPEVAPVASKKSISQEFEAGTSFILQTINGQIQAARRIPVLAI